MMERVFYILFIALMYSCTNAQNILQDKSWVIQEYYAITEGTVTNFYDVKNDDNYSNFKGEVYEFNNTGALNVYVQDTLNSSGNWSFNIQNDSITLNDVSYKIETLNDNLLTIKKEVSVFFFTSEIILQLIPKFTLGTDDFVKINKEENLSNVKLYPLPVRSTLVIQSSVSIPNLNAITINDVSGREIQRFALKRQKDNEVSLEGFNAGVYFVRFYDRNNVSLGVKKIIKKN